MDGPPDPTIAKGGPLGAAQRVGLDGSSQCGFAASGRVIDKSMRSAGPGFILLNDIFLFYHKCDFLFCHPFPVSVRRGVVSSAKDDSHNDGQDDKRKNIGQNAHY